MMMTRIICALLSLLVALPVAAHPNTELRGNIFERLSSPPPAIEGRVYYDTLEKKPKIHNGTGFVPLGSGSGGGSVNYVTSPDGNTDWTASGTGITATTSSTSTEFPRTGYDSQALKLTNDGSDAGGQTHCFQVGDADQGKILGIHYAFNHSGYESGDYTIRVVSDTASDCSGTETAVKLIHRDSSSAVDMPVGDFYDIFHAKTGVYYYQIYIERVAGGASDWVALSSITVGPDVRIEGAVNSPWQSFTADLTNVTEGNATQESKWRQVGDGIQLDVTITLGSTSSVTGNVGFNFATNFGLTLFTDKDFVGSARFFDAGGDRRTGSIIADGSTNDAFFYASGTTSSVVGAASPWTWANGDQIHFSISVPVQEYAGKGTTQMLEQGHLYANARYRGTMGAQSIANTGTTKLLYGTETYDDQNLFASGTFTVPADGKYKVVAKYTYASAPAGAIAYIYKNGAEYSRSYGGTLQQSDITDTIDCVAGDTIEIYASQSSGGAISTSSTVNYNSLTIDRVSDYTHGTGNGLGEATATAPGVVYKNKWQRKTLAADVTADTTLSDLTFSNLVTGKTYGISYNIVGNTNTTDDVFTTSIEHNSATIAHIRIHNDGAADETSTHFVSTQFVAAASTVTFTVSGTSANAIVRGNGTYSETWAMIEELNNYGTESSAF